MRVQNKHFGKQTVFYTIRNLSTDDSFDRAKWEWADFDSNGKRLLWASEGKLFTAKIWEGGHGAAKELADFNAMVFEQRVAPY